LVLAPACAKASEVSATISRHLGSLNDAFDAAMGKLAVAYADLAERDHAALKAAAAEDTLRPGHANQQGERKQETTFEMG
jgi:hypothetical protein